jgi:thermitase
MKYPKCSSVQTLESSRFRLQFLPAFAMALACVLFGTTSADAASHRVAERLLVKSKSQASELSVQGTLAAHGAAELGQLSRTGVRVLRVPEARLEKVLDALRRHPDFEFAEPDAVLAPDAAPNDSYYPSEWHLPKIGAPSAWDVTTGSSSVIIAVLDTGVDGTHPDLSAKMLPGWNMYDNNSDTRDVYGHGTAVAGTAAAASNNGTGVASVAWGCKILPIRISDLNGYATYSTIANGLTYAADHGARVANVSYGASDSSAVASAAQYFQSRGGVVAMAAGNQSTFISAADNPYVLTVSATDANDALASFSNTGNFIDLAAPGVNIYTTTRGGGYGTWWGTSFSSPIVAGAAALVISANPSLSGAQVQDILKQTADDRGTTGWDTSYGHGRVNAGKAVHAAIGNPGTDTVAPTAAITSPSAGSVLSGTLAIHVTASDNVGVTRVELYLNGNLAGTSSTASTDFTWNTAGYADGTYGLQARAYDAAGNAGTSPTVTVTVRNTIPAPDTVAPGVQITSPANGDYVGRNVNVSVQAADNVGVSRVDLYIDGRYFASSGSAAAVFSWNTRRVSRGSHTLQAVAYDAAGNYGLSTIVTVYR